MKNYALFHLFPFFWLSLLMYCCTGRLYSQSSPPIQFNSIQKSAGLPNSAIYDITANDRWQWLGTFGAGLHLMQLPAEASNDWNAQEWEPQFPIFKADGKRKDVWVSNRIRDILQTRRGQLWGNKDSGLRILDKPDLSDSSFGTSSAKSLEVSFQNYQFDSKYIFRVKAANNDSFRKEEGGALTIIEKPAFWETNWFFLLSMLGSLLVIATLFRIYNSNILRRNQELKVINEKLNTEVLQRRAAEESLAKQEQFLRRLMDNIPQYIYWVDTRHRFLGGNISFLQSFDLPSEAELIGKTLGDFNKDLSFVKVQKELETIVMEGDQSIFNKIHSTTGCEKVEVKWFSQSYIPFHNNSGEVIGVLISSEDITTQIKTEEVLKSQSERLNEFNQELKRSNHDLEQFAYIASHDLQAPLRTIKSFVDLLEKSLDDRLDATEKEFMGFITQGVTNMSTLISDLLSFSRVNSRKRKIQEVNLGHLLEGIQLELDALLKEQKALIHCDNIPERITADKVKLKQLLQNLITNGIKFSKEAITPVINISCKEKPSHWQFEVKDNGIGIDQENNEKIFKIFRRLHSSAEYEGTGIGLAICKKIVEQHEGKIWVESEKGEGSNFIFTISKFLN